MRTLDPNNIKADFLAGLQDIRATFSSVEGASLSPASKNLMAEYTFLGGSILMEGFISDLFVAYINRKDGPFVTYLTKRMRVETTDDHAKRAATFATIDIKSHLNQDQIRTVLDSRDWNFSFPTTADLKAKSGQWLDDPYKAYFLGLSNANCAVLEAIKAVRNFLAHRSGAAKTKMQIALANTDLPPGLGRGQRQIHAVGSYLDSKPTAGSPRRLESYLTEFEAVAAVLCP